jgi:hypothetical protein
MVTVPTQGFSLVFGLAADTGILVFFQVTFTAFLAFNSIAVFGASAGAKVLP